jgi:hypothetical protein
MTKHGNHFGATKIKSSCLMRDVCWKIIDESLSNFSGNEVIRFSVESIESKSDSNGKLAESNKP